MTAPTPRPAGVGLEIPAVAADSFFACGCLDLTCDREGYGSYGVPLIVAAELRRLATLAGPGGMLHVDDLTARADELDSEGAS